MFTLASLLTIGVIGSLISGMIGGGSGLILTPVQILLGIDPKVATTTTHFGFIGVSLGALARFRREPGMPRLPKLHTVSLTLLSLLSGLAGPHLLFSVDSEVFQRIIGVLILLCIPLFLRKSTLGVSVSRISVGKRFLGYTLFWLVLTMQVAFGAATGVIAIFVLVYFFGLSMLETSAALRLPNLASSLTGLAVYAKHGTINFQYGFTLLAAMILGGYLGSHLAIKGGNHLVKQLFAGFAVIVSAMMVAL
jgi:uncharacterized membrane protein YfcA